jgi:hypothetical protein
VKASATLGDVHNTAYPVRSVLIIDEKATPEQRLALRSFAKRMSNDLLSDIVKVEYQPVELTVENDNVHSATATLKAGALAAIQTRAIKSGDKVCSPRRSLVSATHHHPRSRHARLCRSP